MAVAVGCEINHLLSAIAKHYHRNGSSDNKADHQNENNVGLNWLPPSTSYFGSTGWPVLGAPTSRRQGTVCRSPAGRRDAAASKNANEWWQATATGQ
jgi:hypothetical protein